MGRFASLICCSLVVSVGVPTVGQEAPSLPSVLDNRLTLELFAEAPDIVTPVGLTFDQLGRLLVIESHTHFPGDDYPGPKSDRIKIVEDLDGDGRADRFRTFLDGTQKTMSLRRGPDSWIYIATRMQVFRTQDQDGDGKADRREVIATLNTEGDYPHNGLCGLCFDKLGNLYFGLGENLGESYTLVGADGKTLRGGGEGGNIYRCRLDGHGIELIATGFWNPFSICTDSVGRLFTVGNDPDASPPCRLLHVVPGGDYGYQFRYGRSGKHPLQAWDGELPGTLPMAAATSEAPSGILLWHGQLYSTSWGEYRIERFRLKPKGASVTADREVVVQGNQMFRPVDLAIAPDGALYFTDWVDKSYNVHQQGRIWRLTWKSPLPLGAVTKLSADEDQAARVAGSDTIDWEALSSADPYLHHAAMMSLKNSSHLTPESLDGLSDPRQRLAILEAARRSDLSDRQRGAILAKALKDDSSAVQLYAVRWIAGEQLKQFRPSLDLLLEEGDVPVQLLRGVLAARDWLDQGAVVSGVIVGEQTLLESLREESRPNLQAMALKTLPPEHESLTGELLQRLIQNDQLDQKVRMEAARTLAISQKSAVDPARWAVIGDRRLSAPFQAIVLTGINPEELAAKRGLERLAKSPVKALRQEASRVLSHSSQAPENAKLSVAAVESQLLDPKLPGDAERGWRVFFGHSSTRCANCHRYDGRGADLGPDLTSIGKRVDRSRLVQSILHPSQEIGPRYVPWLIETVDGRVFTALSLGVSKEEEKFLTTDGRQISVSREMIAHRKLDTQSIMPAGIHQQYSVQELRDLISLLSR
ncbi:MAG: c-type cytochrome [Pirellulaceae bacterium]|nr:c-type cytochrome [Pirellulaceae bacterium]